MKSNLNRVQTICRIRPPLVQERSKSPISPISKNKSPQNSSLLKDQMLSIFSSNDQNPSLVVATEKSIQNKLIQKEFQTDNDLINYKDSVLEQSSIFKFDKVLRPENTQSQTYKLCCQDLINQTLNGTNSSIIIYGCSKSGKSYTLRGLENKEIGLLIHTTEDLLNLIEIQKQTNQKQMANRYSLQVSFLAIYEGQYYDLLMQKQNALYLEPNSNSVQGITKQEIRFISEFKNYYRVAVGNQKYISQIDQSFQRDNCHFIVQYQLVKYTDMVPYVISKLNFAKLAYTEYKDSQSQKFNDYIVLQKYLFQLRTQKQVQFKQRHSNLYQDSSLTQILSDSYNFRFICCVNSSKNNFVLNYQSLKYGSFIGSQTNDENEEEDYEDIHHSFYILSNKIEAFIQNKRYFCNDQILQSLNEIENIIKSLKIRIDVIPQSDKQIFTIKLDNIASVLDNELDKSNQKNLDQESEQSSYRDEVVLKLQKRKEKYDLLNQKYKMKTEQFQLQENKYQRIIRDLEIENQELREKNKIYKKPDDQFEKHKYEDIIQEMKVYLSQNQDQMKSQVEQLRDQMNEKTDLVKEIQTLKNQLNDLKIQEDKNNYKLQFEQQQYNEQLKQEIENLKEEKQRHWNLSHSKQEQFKIMKKQIQLYETEISEMRQDNQQLVEENHDLITQNKKINKDVENILQENQSLVQQFNQIQNDLFQNKQQWNELVDDNQQMDDKIKEQQYEIMKLNEFLDKQQIEKENNLKNNKIEQEKIQKLQKEIQELKQDKNLQQELQMKMEKQLDFLQKKSIKNIDQLDHSINEIQKEKNKYQEQILEYKLKYEHLENQNQRFKIENENLKKQIKPYYVNELDQNEENSDEEFSYQSQMKQEVSTKDLLQRLKSLESLHQKLKNQ